MNEEQIQQLKSLVIEADELPAEAKSRLLELLTKAEQPSEAAEGSGEHPATPFMASVEELEATYPQATSFLNRVATVLANMGI